MLCQMFQSIIIYIGEMFTQALLYRWHEHHPYCCLNTFYNVLLLYENNTIVLYLHARYRVGGMIPGARPL